MNISEIRDVVAEDPEIRKEGVFAAEIEVPGSNGPTLLLIAEFGGPRVTNMQALRNRLTERIRSIIGQRELLFEIVREGWLEQTDHAAPESNLINRYRGLCEARGLNLISVYDIANNIGEREKDAFAYFGSHSKIRTPTTIQSPGRIEIGNWVSLGRFCKIFMQLDFRVCLPIIEQHYPNAELNIPENIWGDRNPCLRIGDGTTLGDLVFINCNGQIDIGNHVGIADRVFISDANHIYNHPEIPPAIMPNELSRPVSIGDHCWLGINAVVLNGAKIGKHSIISSNSVVANDVPSYSMAVGNPAKIVPIPGFEKERRAISTQTGESKA